MKVTTRKEVTTIKIYELTQNDIEDIIRQHLGINGDGEVAFNCTDSGLLLGAKVKSTYTVVNL